MNVRVLVRSNDQSELAKAQGWAPVFGDLTQAATLKAAFEDVDMTVHCAAVGGPDLPRAKLVNVDGTRAMTERAIEAGVERFVHISTLSVHGDPLPLRVDEETELATTDPQPYCATKALAELAVGEARARGLETVILRPGMICHWVRSQWGDEMVERLRARGWPNDLHPDDVLPWVHTLNLAEMTWLALTRPEAANETFLAIDRNVAMDEFFVPIARALGQPVRLPDRAPVATVCKVGKIASRLGYRPIHSFEETMEHLLNLAKSSRVST
jgi:nucleoside-diphosphate-sugar epimerase